MTAIHVFETAFGFCGLGWTPSGVVRFHLPEADRAAAETALRRLLPGASLVAPDGPARETVAATVRYFDGAPQEFGETPLDLGGSGAFARRVYAALTEVGWGETTTYGALARAIGEGPEAARAVGVAMARNPIPLIIPCHRVLAAGDAIGGFSAPGGRGTKLRMLALEGAPVARQASFAF